MDEYFNERGFSKVNKIVDIYNFDPESKVFTCTSKAALIVNSGLPANCTMSVPIENPKGINRWVNGKWIDDVDYGNMLLIEHRKEKIAELENEFSTKLTKFTLKQSVGRITKEEDELRIKIINYLIDLDDFPVDDLSKEIPIFK